jgi:thymidylate kinase
MVEVVSMTGPFIAEIIGPAGAGKTTLSQLLKQHDIRSGLSLWRLRPASLAASAFSSIPNVVAMCVQRKRFDWEEMKLVIQHNALLRLLKTETASGYRAVLLDEGAIFALAKLQAFKSAKARGDDRWLHKLFKAVAAQVNAVIWLDAPDDVLVLRIRERAKPHRMKHRSDIEIANHLSSYRRSFESVVEELTKLNGLQVFRYRTDKLPLEEIAAQVRLQARVQQV